MEFLEDAELARLLNIWLVMEFLEDAELARLLNIWLVMEFLEDAELARLLNIWLVMEFLEDEELARLLRFEHDKVVSKRYENDLPHHQPVKWPCEKSNQATGSQPASQPISQPDRQTSSSDGTDYTAASPPEERSPVRDVNDHSLDHTPMIVDHA
ncbi:hypothetical protein RRG08_047561 [Elysia crispata]|uniref:Uncharacterized protein n=1 Tax=Elysia crispata TaxID=231223 RepID=A0AAE0YQG5_9GAST|nr:hypothetical protein RRG08_047561 [Elysia crispata]